MSGSDSSTGVASTDHAPGLWPVLLFTWLTSFGTAVGWNGIFYVTQHEYGFSAGRNLVLGILLGASYALAAWFASPLTRLLRRLAGPGRFLSSRCVLGILLVLAAGSALLPVLVRAEWGIWACGLIYNPLAGLIWPVVESYVSSGRRGRALNRATGRFNYAWASALIVGMWAMVPLIEDYARWVIGGLAVIHVLTLPLLLFFGREPMGHGDPAHEYGAGERERLRRLLLMFRVSLVSSYALLAALGPLLPFLMGGVGIGIAWKPAVASSWMVMRLGAMIVMGNWAGWHGRGVVALVAFACMLVGFIGALTASGAFALIGALAMLGLGVGIVYSAAIYYALEVGSTEVDAGGKHEAFIGVGYTVGPIGTLALERAFGVS